MDDRRKIKIVRPLYDKYECINKWNSHNQTGIFSENNLSDFIPCQYCSFSE